ncbi:MAG: T9SS type A sorting domain-containing protein [Ignavibacteriae bacterium]|nr:T9SS type A sorting domain-containing protein [Ignavibacteriota bacterium]
MKFKIAFIILLLFSVKLLSQKSFPNQSPQFTFEENIDHIGQWNSTGQTTSVFVSNNFAFITTNNKLEILDISTPNVPQLIGELTLGSSFFSEDIVGNSEKIFVANNRTIYEFDIANPNSPDSIASITLDAIINDIFISENILYAIASYDFYILDISSENTISILGKLALPESSLGLTRFDVEGNFAYIGSWAAGVFIVEIEDPQNPKLHGRFLENSHLVFVNGTNAYVADLDYIYMLDITDTVLPSILLRKQIIGIPQDLIADEKNLYVSTNDGVEIYGKDDLNFIASYSLNDVGERILIENDFIFVANNEEGVNILKYNNPSSTINSDEIKYIFNLYQNYPNPFNSSTIIRYQLPEHSQVKLSVYDILGNKIAELVNEYKFAGSYKTEFNAKNLTSGIYFYKLKTSNGYSVTKKFLFLK